MVTPREERCPRRRAHRCGMKVGVAETLLGNTVHCRCGDNAPKGAGHTITRIVGHDQQNIGRIFWRYHAGRPIGCRINNIGFNLTAKCLVGWRWKLLSVDGRCGARGTGCSSSNRKGRASRNHQCDQRCNNDISVFRFHGMNCHYGLLFDDVLVAILACMSP